MIGNANVEWLKTMELCYNKGFVSRPRGKMVKELLHHVIQWKMEYPVVYEKARGLSYTFMAAEAAWILSGSNRLDYHPEIQHKLQKYSDDGLFMAGAYGPRVAEQLEWVIAKLKGDRDTRQAVMEIWRPMPPESRDIPCTLALQFFIRDGRLYMSAFMRSSDIWMGLPYDMFSFTCIAHTVAVMVEAELGMASLTAGSSHLYDYDLPKAREVLFRPRMVPVMWQLRRTKSVIPILISAMNSKKQSEALAKLLEWKTDDEA